MKKSSPKLTDEYVEQMRKELEEHFPSTSPPREGFFSRLFKKAEPITSPLEIDETKKKEPEYVNRTAIRLRLKTDFLKLVAAADGDDLSEIMKSPWDNDFIFLLPEFLSREGAQSYIEKHCKTIMKYLFELHFESKKDYPKVLNIQSFNRFFEWEFTNNVCDINI